MKRLSILVLLIVFLACDGWVVEPCPQGADPPVLQIASAVVKGTNTSISAISLRDLALDGQPVDPTEVVRRARNIELRSGWLDCTLPCGFGTAEGTYTFEMFAPHYNRTSAQVTATYLAASGECPNAPRGPTRFNAVLAEADSARLVFGLVLSRASGLTPEQFVVQFDDGTGPRSAVGGSALFRSTIETRNTGTLRVHFTLTAPDTVAAGGIELSLRRDWIYSVSIHVANTNPQNYCFGCTVVPLPMRRGLASGDSTYIVWGGNWISAPVVY